MNADVTPISHRLELREARDQQRQIVAAVLRTAAEEVRKLEKLEERRGRPSSVCSHPGRSVWRGRPILGRGLGLERVSSPALLHLVDELLEVASQTSDLGFRDSPTVPPDPHAVGVTVKRYAKAHRLSERRVRQMINEDKLHAVQPGGPRTRWLIHE